MTRRGCAGTAVGPLLTLLVFISAVTAENEPQVTPQRQLIVAQRYEEAESLLERTLRSKQIAADQRWLYVVDLAKVRRLRGKPKAALAALEELDAIDRDRPAVTLETARCQLLDKQATENGRRLLRLLHDAPTPEIRCYARFETAKHDFADSRHEQCIELCESVIRDFGKIVLVNEYGVHHEDETALRQLLANTRSLLADAKDRLAEQRYGEDYANYRKARVAQFRDDWKEAIRHYGLIQAPILSDAAKCYGAACLAADGQLAAADQLYQQFIEADRLGLYRGEAMLERARLRLLHATRQSDLDEAERLLNGAVAWLDEVSSHAAPVTPESLRAVLKAFPVPEDLARPDRFGNYHKLRVGPETIINRLTAKWYLPDLRVQVNLLLAFTVHELGGTERASEILRQLEVDGRALHVSIPLARELPDYLSTEARDGAFLLTPLAWRSLSPQYAVRIHLAMFLYCAGDLDASAALFNSVLHEVRGKAGQPQDWGACEFGLACIAFRQGREREAMDRLNLFDHRLRPSTSTPLAWLVHANLLTSKRGGLEGAASRYEGIVRYYSDSDVAPRALLALALAAEHHGDRNRSEQAVELLVRRYGKTACATAAQTLRAHLTGASIAGQARDPDAGSVVPMARHLIIPGEADLALRLSDRSGGDLFDCTLGWTVREGCNIQNFYHRLNPVEPQVPPVDQSPLRYLRAAALLGVE